MESDEYILRQERIHPAIFILPALLFVTLLIPMLPTLFFVKTALHTFDQLTPLGGTGGTGGQGGFSLLWLLPMSLDLLIFLATFTVVLLGYLNSETILTNKRLMYRTGFVTRAAGELPLENIEGMFILEPLLGRLLGYGTITVTTLGGARYVLAYISKPQVFHMLLQKAVGAAKDAALPASKPASAPQDDSRYMPGVDKVSSASPKRSQDVTHRAQNPFRRFSPGMDCAEPQRPTSARESVFLVVAIWTVLALVVAIALLAVFQRPGTSPDRAALDSPTPAPYPIEFASPTLLPLPQTAPPQHQSPPVAEIKAAAERGEAEAQDRLGDIYCSDPSKAVIWYRKAALQGIANSQYQLAHILMSWANSPLTSKEIRAQHFDEAIPWLIKAANRGVKQAQVELGSIYRDGKGITKDLPEAYKWFCLAADGTAMDFAANTAKGHRDGLVLDMSQDQIAEGNRRVTAFAPNSGDDVQMPEPSYVKQIRLSGIGGVPPHRFAMINGKTLAAGESATLNFGARAVTLHCLAITDQSASVTISGLAGLRELRLSQSGISHRR
jgi:hypothetical protein